ncbi:MAG: hypothetical protein WD800_01745 [Dehalococcoidia bacterium]
MPLDALDLTTSLLATWRVPNEPMFLIGFIIVGWGLASGILAFRGSQRSGQHEYHLPREESEVAVEPEDVPLPESDQ